jgi:hypothetical protein
MKKRRSLEKHAFALFLALLLLASLAPARRGGAAAGDRLVGGEVYPMVFPVAGDHVLTDSFGDPRGGGRRHAGVDIMADKMVPVLAVADAVVGWVHDERGGNCCDVALVHDDGWRSRYIHLNNDTAGTDDGRAVGIAPGVREGAKVVAGQVIGWVGDSGNAESTAPHLHFELRRPDGTPVDPYASLLAAKRRGRPLVAPPIRPERREEDPAPGIWRWLRREKPRADAEGPRLPEPLRDRPGGPDAEWVVGLRGETPSGGGGRWSWRWWLEGWWRAGRGVGAARGPGHAAARWSMGGGRRSIGPRSTGGDLPTDGWVARPSKAPGPRAAPTPLPARQNPQEGEEN